MSSSNPGFNPTDPDPSIQAYISMCLKFYPKPPTAPESSRQSNVEPESAPARFVYNPTTAPSPGPSPFKLPANPAPGPSAPAPSVPAPPKPTQTTASPAPQSAAPTGPAPLPTATTTLRDNPYAPSRPSAPNTAEVFSNPTLPSQAAAPLVPPEVTPELTDLYKNNIFGYPRYWNALRHAAIRDVEALLKSLHALSAIDLPKLSIPKEQVGIMDQAFNRVQLYPFCFAIEDGKSSFRNAENTDGVDRHATSTIPEALATFDTFEKCPRNTDDIYGAYIAGSPPMTTEQKDAAVESLGLIHGQLEKAKESLEALRDHHAYGKAKREPPILPIGKEVIDTLPARILESP